MPPSVIFTSDLLGFAPKTSSVPVMPVDGIDTVPVAWVDVWVRIAWRPPIAVTCRSMMVRAVAASRALPEGLRLWRGGRASAAGLAAGARELRRLGSRQPDSQNRRPARPATTRAAHSGCAQTRTLGSAMPGANGPEACGKLLQAGEASSSYRYSWREHKPGP